MAKLRFFTFSYVQLTSGILLCLLMVIAASGSLQAQPVLGGQNTGLGSGGTAYLTGIEATFWNPANLAINDRHGIVHVGIGQAGILYEPVLSTNVAGDQFFNFTDSFFPYKPNAASIDLADRNSILDKNYPRSKTVSPHQTRADLLLGGISWQRKDAAFSLVARTRFASKIDVGRGWYSDEFISSGDQEIRDFTLNQRINQFFEVSLGYGREFTFIEGLLPRISKLYVGIAPKLIISGPSFDATYNARYVRTEDGSSQIYTSDFSYQTTGDYTQMTADYLNASDPRTATENNLNRSFKFQDNGYGVGFDFGLTYLVPLGSDLNLIEDDPKNSVVSNSLRFSFSVNDLGIIRYTDQPLKLSSPTDSVQIAQEAPQDFMFIGSGGQYLTYFENADALPNPFENSEAQIGNEFLALLPTSLNAGVLIDLTRLKLSGDLTLGLNNTAFTSTKLAIHLGLELRPLKSVPLQMGTRLAPGLPTHIGLGTGIETRYWDFNIGTQIILRSRTFTSEFVGGAFAGVQLHL